MTRTELELPVAPPSVCCSVEGVMAGFAGVSATEWCRLWGLKTTFRMWSGGVRGVIFL